MKRKKLPLWMVIGSALMVLWFFAFAFARSLAAWFYEVEIATRHQVDAVKLALSIPVAVLFLLLFLWAKWADRRRHRAGVRQALYGAKFEDPGHELRLDRTRRDVD